MDHLKENPRDPPKNQWESAFKQESPIFTAGMCYSGVGVIQIWIQIDKILDLSCSSTTHDQTAHIQQLAWNDANTMELLIGKARQWQPVCSRCFIKSLVSWRSSVISQWHQGRLRNWQWAPSPQMLPLPPQRKLQWHCKWTLGIPRLIRAISRSVDQSISPLEDPRGSKTPQQLRLGSKLNATELAVAWSGLRKALCISASGGKCCHKNPTPHLHQQSLLHELLAAKKLGSRRKLWVIGPNQLVTDILLNLLGWCGSDVKTPTVNIVAVGPIQYGSNSQT